MSPSKPPLLKEKALVTAKSSAVRHSWILKKPLVKKLFELGVLEGKIYTYIYLIDGKQLPG